MITDILDIKEEMSPWRHTKSNNLLPKEICDEIVNYIDDHIERATVENKFDNNINSISLSNTQVDDDFEGQTREFLMNLLDKEYHKKIFELYDVDYSTGWDITGCLELEVCGPEAMNGYHNDVAYGDGCITLQYYLKIEDEQRQLVLDDQPSGILDGGAVMFKSEPHTHHGFKSGNGKRYNLRLRLKPNITSPFHLRNEDLNDHVGVIIDCKDMESNTKFPDLASSLGMITLDSLVNNDFHNIILYKSRMHITYVAKKLKQSGIKKVLYIFAGAVVGDMTKDSAQKTKTPVANIDSDGNVLRQVLWLDVDDLPFTVNDPFGEGLEGLEKCSLRQFDIHYIHTEEATYKFLEYIAKRETPPADTLQTMTPGDKLIAIQLETRTKHLLTKPFKTDIMSIKI